MGESGVGAAEVLVIDKVALTGADVLVVVGSKELDVEFEEVACVTLGPLSITKSKA